ncbi:unnamed protein product [Gongylonema pulchrum]|uniref:Secreted protein n=1 Tax=Gongylonema pulchrum TaxID=637853 RepID=A0A183F1D3_9BILA|nr:unnamed protein product [Gongylonema pulchrum]
MKILVMLSIVWLNLSLRMVWNLRNVHVRNSTVIHVLASCSVANLPITIDFVCFRKSRNVGHSYCYS